MPISRPDDPIEAIVFDALTRAGIPFVMGRQAKGLDFLMTESDVYIECKQFHTPRTAEQMARVGNVIVIQGRGAATAFARMIAGSADELEKLRALVPTSHQTSTRWTIERERPNEKAPPSP